MGCRDHGHSTAEIPSSAISFRNQRLKRIPCVAHGNASLAGKEASACLKETLCVWVWKAFLCVVGGISLHDAKHSFELREYIPISATFAHPTQVRATTTHQPIRQRACAYTHTHRNWRGTYRVPLKAGGGLPSPKNLPPIIPLSFSPSHGVKGIKKMLGKVKSVPMT